MWSFTAAALVVATVAATAGCSDSPAVSPSPDSPSPQLSAELRAACQESATGSGGSSLTYDVALTLVGKPGIVCLVDAGSGSTPSLKDVPAEWSTGKDWALWVSTDKPLPPNCVEGTPPTQLVYVDGEFIHARNPVCSS